MGKWGYIKFCIKGFNQQSRNQIGLTESGERTEQSPPLFGMFMPNECLVL